MSLTSLIKEQARWLGFNLVGITTPAPLLHFGVYEGWLKAGYHGSMGYLATDRARNCRADPTLLLRDCRSIIVIGMPYPAPVLRANSVEAGENNSSQIAAFACGDDYHDFIPETLRLLIGFIEAQVGHPVNNRYYTDTGPLLERELAQRAGLGWIGKNSCLINPSFGSYILLAEILIDLELETARPWEYDRCGTCSRCIQSCPTGCILPDRTIDARRCISYLTIELKEPIPVELRPFLGDRVFGCDICQQVCPWNVRFANKQYENIFQSHPEIYSIDLRQEIHLTHQAFNRKYGQTPIKRAKRRGYLRNIAVNMGNSCDSGNIPDLVICLINDPEPLVRGHAAWALARIGGDLSQQILGTAQQVETDPYVLSEMHSALIG